MIMPESRELWITLSEVYAQCAVHGFQAGEGAFVNVLTFGQDREEAERVAADALIDAGFEAKSFEGTQLWHERISEFEVDKDLHILADIAQRTQRVQFGSFNVWDVETGTDE